MGFRSTLSMATIACATLDHGPVKLESTNHGEELSDCKGVGHLVCRIFLLIYRAGRTRASLGQRHLGFDETPPVIG